MILDKNYRIEYTPGNVVLVFHENRIREKKDGTKETYEYRDETYHKDVKQALKAFLQKSLYGSETVEIILSRIQRLETVIDNLHQ